MKPARHVWAIGYHLRRAIPCVSASGRMHIARSVNRGRFAACRMPAWQVPTAASIRAAIGEEAKRRGIATTLEEPPARRPSKPHGGAARFYMQTLFVHTTWADLHSTAKEQGGGGPPPCSHLQPSQPCHAAHSPA